MHDIHANCGAPVFWVSFDYGRCAYTGYHDSGHVPECEKCGRIDEGDIKEKNDEN